MLSFKDFITEEDQPFSPNHVSVYPHGQGVDVGDNVPRGPATQIPVNRASGNEPFKDPNWFKSPEKKPYMDKMQADIKSGKKMPPVMSIQSPWNSSHNVVVDGNHRLQAHKVAGVPTVSSTNISHDDVHIMPNNYGEKNEGVPLSSFKEKDGSYDMHKPRPELGGKALKHYFVQPDGQHSFDSPFK